MLLKLKERKYFLFCVLAAVSAAIIAAADYLLEYTGNSEQTTTFVDPFWASMSSWRFPLSLNLCAFFIPFYLLGFWAIRRRLALTHPRSAKVYFGTVSYGVIMGASFIHSVLSYFPMIYQKLTGAGQEVLAEEIINNIMTAIMPVFIVHYILSWVVPQILLFILIIRGKTHFNRWTAFLNPFIFLVFGSLCALLFPQELQFLYVGIINKGNVALFVLAAIYEYKFWQHE
ncbi:MAG: hypothetical protein K0R50_2231 [Eubacterium sp.]|jgi:hypothetical protein|nr:hypothetical protein [Eubacterium sp.]